MQKLLKPLVLIVLALLVPIVPFVLFGETFAPLVTRWQATPPSSAILATAAILLLASDVLLPVPSSAVNTLAGAQLGAVAGSIVCAIGLTLGALVGFSLARLLGRPLAERFTTPDDLKRLESACHGYGPLVLVVTRPIPILAEATVLLMGTMRLSWKQFLLPVVASNVAIATVYSFFGHYAQQHGWLVFAIVLSIALPILLTMIARRMWPQPATQDKNGAELETDSDPKE